MKKKPVVPNNFQMAVSKCIFSLLINHSTANDVYQHNTHDSRKPMMAGWEIQDGEKGKIKSRGTSGKPCKHAYL